MVFLDWGLRLLGAVFRLGTTVGMLHHIVMDEVQVIQGDHATETNQTNG